MSLVRRIEPRSVPPLFLILLFLGLGVGGCSESGSTGPETPPAEVRVAVVNSIELSLTVFPLSDPTARRTIPLGPEGTPVGGAVRGDLAAIPMGIVPAVAIVDLVSGTVLRTVSLPAGSGATGAHFVNDSIVLVANPLLNSVSPVNARSGAVAAPIPTGTYPQGFVETSGIVFVVNAELEAFVPAGNGTLTALDAATLQVLGTVELSGENPGSAAVGPEGGVYVLNAGNWGVGDSGLSTVDPSTLQEVRFDSGFGDFPGSLAVSPDGRLFASSWSFGVVAWDLSSSSFTRGPEDAVAPDGIPSSAGVAIDPTGALWSLLPECAEPGAVLRLEADFEVGARVPVGVCPSAILFTDG